MKSRSEKSMPMHVSFSSSQVDSLSCNNGDADRHPVVVCLHGIGGNSQSFEPQLRGLADHFHVLSVDLPGYGDSERLTNTSFAALADWLLQFLDQQGLATVHLVGQSIGGMLALEFALRHPARLKSLSLIATTSAFGGRDDSFKQQFLQDRLEPLDNGLTMPDLACQFVPEIVGSGADDVVIASAINSMSQVPLQTYRDIISCLVTFNRRADLQQLTMPVCLLAGDEDRNAPAVTMKKMSEKITKCEYHLFEKTGHLVNLEQGARANNVLKSFFLISNEL